MSNVRAAVVGLGFTGRTHIASLRRLGIDVCGVMGVNEQESRSAAAELNLGCVYRSYGELLTDPNVTVVHLCTPNHLHYPQAKAALLAGKHVVCEKPLAMTPAESAELVALAQEKGVFTAVNYNLRFYPLVQEARMRIAAGEVGTPYLIHGGYLQDWLLLKTDWNWRLNPEQGGHLRVVADIGTHWMDLASYLTGLKITAVMADLVTLLPTRIKPAGEVETFASKVQAAQGGEEVTMTTEDAATLLVRFENGARGTVTLSQVSAGRKNYLWWEINGSQASMRWEQEDPNQLWIGHRETANQQLIKDPGLMDPAVRRLTGYPGGHAEGYPDTFVMLFKQFYGAVRSGKLPETGSFATFADGHHEMLLCQAVQLSARQKRWVDLSEVGA